MPLHPPFNLIAALLGARGLGLAAAFGAAGFMRALQSQSYRIAPDRSVAQLLAEHAQHGRLRSHLWEPLCVSALNTPADRASAQVFAVVLRDALTGARANSDLLIPRADLGTLFPQPAAHYVHAHGGTLRPGVAVRSIARAAGAGFVIDDRPERYRQVILAVAPQHATALIAPLVAHCPALAATRKQIEGLAYEPIVTCYLQYPQGVSLGVPMLGFTGGMVQWAFDRGVIAGNGAAGPSGCGGLIAVVISASGAHQELGNDVLATRVHAEIRPTLKHAASAPPAPLWSRTIHEKRATFSCTPALERPPGATPQAGLWLAGDYVASDYPATLESAVRSGIAAAMGVIGR